MTVAVVPVTRRLNSESRTVAPDAVLANDLDDGHAMGFEFGVDDFRRRGSRVVGGEHEFRVRVLVIEDQQAMVRCIGADWQWQVTDVIAVVADLQRLPGGSEIGRIKFRSICSDWIAPTNERRD